MNAAKPKNSLRLDFIDGLRAFACLMVMVCHTHIVVPASIELPLGSKHLDLSPYLFSGYSGVNLFLVISGFCLYWPFVRPDKRPEPMLWEFAKRRCRRILPPYYVACFLAAALAVLRHQDAPAFAARWLGVHLLLLQTTLTGYDVTIPDLGQAWSVALEFQCYLLFPLFVELYRRFPPRLTLLGLLLFSAAYRWYVAREVPVLNDDTTLNTDLAFNLVSNLYGRCFEFALGMFCAHSVAEWNRTGKSPLRVWDWCVALAALMYAIPLIEGSSDPLARFRPLDDAALGIVYGMLLMIVSRPPGGLRRLLVPDPLVRPGVVTSAVSFVHGALHRIFSHPLLVRLGVVSYSVYLVHMAVFRGIDQALHISNSPNSLQILLSFGLFIPSAVAVGAGFHILFERPFLSSEAKRGIATELREKQLIPMEATP